jgi:hypothetical protein
MKKSRKRHHGDESKPTPALRLGRINTLREAEAAPPWLVAQAREMVRIGPGWDADFHFGNTKNVSTVSLRNWN